MQIPSRFPRSLLPMLLVMIIAIAGFLFLRDDDSDSVFITGGSIFPVPAEDIMVMHLTRNNVEYKFERFGPYGWSLSGGVNDFVDAKAMFDLLEFLATVKSGSVLPGTTPGDKRYEFDGEDSIRLAVFATEGREFRLTLGAQNPVTSGVYAYGAGRPGCFPVGQGLRNNLKALPLSVQQKNLLPPMDTAALTEIEVWRGSEKILLRPEGSRWWVQEPEDGMAQLGVPFRLYNEFYADRRVISDGQPWLLADPMKIEKLIFDASQVMVRDIISPDEAQARMEEWSMDPSWRKVVFHGQGINKDPNIDNANQQVLTYGPPLENAYVPIMRQGNLLLVDKTAAGVLGEPLGQWLDIGAMPFRAETGDSLTIDQEGRRLLVATPGQEDDISRWVGTFSHMVASSFEDRGRENAIETLIVNLDRLEVLQVLEPSDKAWVLEDSERLQLTFWTSSEGSSEPRNVEFGWLDLDHLPGGDGDKARQRALEADGQRPAGMWIPDTGKLLQVPAHLIIKFRNLEKAR
jgi:hypothetical protein